MSAALTRLAHRLRSEHGITMIELVVSMAVLGIFFATFATVIGSSISHSSTIQEQSVLQTEVRAAADTLVADLRQATVAGDTSLARISEATATKLTFLSPDRRQPMRLRRISYQVTGNLLQRAIATSTNTAPPWSIPALGSWATIARSIVTTGTPVFTYYDASNAVTAVAANVNSVRVRITVAPISNANEQLSYDTRVQVRSAS